MIFTSIEIAKSPEEVKKVFFDFSSYPTWHTGVFKSIKPLSDDNKPLAVGDKVHCIMEGVPEFDAIITENSPTTFSWKGPPVKGVAGLHTFEFQPSEVTKGGTTFVQREEFEGLMSFLLQSWLLGRPLVMGYNGFNADLKRRAEAL